jgi:hypothetical protein
MRSRILSSIPILGVLAVSLAFAASLAVMSTPAMAQDIDHLGGSQQRLDDRMQLAREEFKERQREIREMAERAREAKKHHRAPGKHVELIPADSDQAAAALARAANPFGSLSTFAVPTNARVNSKIGESTGVYTAGEAEQSVAFLGLNGLCAWNDGRGFYRSPTDVQSYGISTDGGATWTDKGILPKTGTITYWSSDPVVSVNEKTGEFYYCGLTANGTTANGLGVARGHFSGSTFVWDGVSIVASGANSAYAYDKQWLVADSLSGNLYCSWTLFSLNPTIIQYSRSTDGGLTWSAPITMNGTWETGVSGSRPAVGPNGEVYLTYQSIGPTDADSLKIAKSTNGGASFSPAVVAGTCMDAYFNGAPGFNRGRAVTFPSIAVDRSTGPGRGRVYLAVQNSVNFYYDTFPALINANYVPEVENNGNFKNATPFTVGKNLRGALSSSAEIDNFKFPATQGTTYVFYADSVRTSTFKYTMRLYCPNDTSVVSRLAMSSDGSSSSSTNVHALMVWTCPTSGTYYLRMQGSTSTGGYRIRTTTHTPVVTDLGRDVRDATVFSSANGQTGWSGAIRANDDAALYDNWLPEVAVANDGTPYTMWFDWRDTPSSCFGGSNIYMSRSLDGGATWSSNVKSTDATTANWTQVLSNIAPNQGDYNGIYGGDCIAMAWADGRLGDSDVYANRLLTNYTLSGCPADQVVLAGLTTNNTATITNLNQLFANTYTYTVSVNAAWPGYPATGTVTAGANGSVQVPVNVTPPDSAAHGEVVTVCTTVSLNGALVQSCCFNATVHQLPTATLASLASSTAEMGRVSLSWLVSAEDAVNVYRTADGTSWDVVGQVMPNQGMVDFVDTSVQAGAHYGYQLGLMQAGREILAGQTWVDVPVTAEFAVGRVFPSPAKSGFSVSFSLPSSAPATLDVIDLAGRRVLSRQVGSMGAGRHTLSLGTDSGRLPVGIYAVRLSQSGKVASSKVTVIR